ncbi:MAG: ABC transporter ATP-binding protein [Acidocella sp.]|nr:ABC transporter ATP-binding protein [Acidocella sp.]
MAKLIAQNVTVSFPLYHGESRSLKKTVFAAASGRLGQDKKHRLVVEALRDVSFSLKTGDRLGFVGSNGAGKTTLLRTMAGIYEPVAGSITIDGAITALLDPGQGMNFDLTGNENIRLRALFSGYPESEITRLQADVAEFAELDQFLDLPVRTYSSGMVVRLGFALATAIKPQILLMDEWILAGDASFMDKARHRLETMVRGADILVLSSHSAEIIMQWCNRVIWMDRGQVRADGTPEEVLAAYLPPEQFAQVKAAADVAV